jgi:hypothetical protein
MGSCPNCQRHYKKAGDDGEGEGDNIDRVPISQSLNQQRKRNTGSNENSFLNHWLMLMTTFHLRLILIGTTFSMKIQNFRHKYGHYNASPVLHKLLHQWINDQRQGYFDNTLKGNRKYLLNMIQFPFETVKNPAVTAASEWSKMYNELRNFHTQRGHVRVLPTDNAVMYHWTQDQQEAYKQNTLADNRKYLLDQVQFPFESILTVTDEEQHLKHDSDWYNYCKELSTFHAKNGHCRVFHEENELLYQWTMAQRKTFEDEFLLDQVNFPWPSQRK